jgi:hypothetical protein
VEARRIVGVALAIEFRESFINKVPALVLSFAETSGVFWGDGLI